MHISNEEIAHAIAVGILLISLGVGCGLWYFGIA
jgi:hypothetical protein